MHLALLFLEYVKWWQIDLFTIFTNPSPVPGGGFNIMSIEENGSSLREMTTSLKAKRSENMCIMFTLCGFLKRHCEKNQYVAIHIFSSRVTDKHVNYPILTYIFQFMLVMKIYFYLTLITNQSISYFSFY